MRPVVVVPPLDVLEPPLDDPPLEDPPPDEPPLDELAGGAPPSEEESPHAARAAMPESAIENQGRTKEA